MSLTKFVVADMGHVARNVTMRRQTVLAEFIERRAQIGVEPVGRFELLHDRRREGREQIDRRAEACLEIAADHDGHRFDVARAETADRIDDLFVLAPRHDGRCDTRLFCRHLELQ